MNVVQDIATGLMLYEGAVVPEDVSKGEYVEQMLTQVCYLLADVADITEGKADYEFILGVVGSYLIAKDKGTLEEDAKPPSVLFDTIMFPSIAEMELVHETIGEDEAIDGSKLIDTEVTEEV